MTQIIRVICPAISRRACQKPSNGATPHKNVQSSLNLVIRQSWAYSDLMPVVPVIGTGLSPLLRWIAVPLAGFWFARRTLSATARG